MKSNRRERSGQVLLVSALIIALIMSSTAIYIYELGGKTEGSETSLLNDYVCSLKLGIKNAAISALANVTNGGPNQTLSDNLDSLKEAVRRQYAIGQFTLEYALRDVEPHSIGLLLFWGTNGSGTSEAYVDYTVETSGTWIEMTLEDHCNISTQLYVEGSLTQIEPSLVEISVLVSVFNEGLPASAKNVTICYRETVEWLEPTVDNSYVLTDYGNGTYKAVFTVQTSASSVDVSANFFDQRDIFVQANATC